MRSFNFFSLKNYSTYFQEDRIPILSFFVIFIRYEIVRNLSSGFFLKV